MYVRIYEGLRAAPVVLVVALAALAAGCGDSSGGGGTASNQDTKNAYTPAPQSGCGSYAAALPKDPDGVLKELPAKQRDALRGLTAPDGVHSSPWVDFKAKSDSGWKIGIVYGALNNTGQIEGYNEIKKTLERDKRVSKVTGAIATSSVDVPQQIQAINSMVNQGFDAIVLEALVPDSLAPPIDRAASKGIPVITQLGIVGTKNAINMGFNDYLLEARSLSTVVRLNKGEGNYLIVHGIPGTGPDVSNVNALKAVMSRCPKAKVAGDAYGNYAAAQAKAETLKFLATHPQKIDGVAQSGVMTAGVMQAFEQAGRPMPTVVDAGNRRGSMGYWRNHQDTYNGTGAGVNLGKLGAATADVALRTLSGEGPITSLMFAELPQFTPDNLDEWSDPTWKLTTPGSAPGPPVPFWTPEYANAFFKNPGN